MLAVMLQGAAYQSRSALKLLATTRHRTPLGVVGVGRLQSPGDVEIAGPGSGSAVVAVSDLMLALGATRVQVDGSFDRRAAASPRVSDGVVLATGAVIHRQAAKVVRRTAAAAALLYMPVVSDRELRPLVRATTGHMVVGAGRRAPRAVA